MSESDIFMFLGFLLAAYAIVANDAIRTLGTFLSSNSNRPWWLLWLFACSILVLVTVSGWWVNQGDIAFGRLEKFPPPAYGFSWIYAISPLCILVLTYFGIPVSSYRCFTPRFRSLTPPTVTLFLYGDCNQTRL